jgi:uncharacterized protein
LRRWIVGLLAAPTLLYLVALAVWMAVAPAPSPDAAQGGELPSGILAILERMGSGGLADAFIGNLVFLAGRWIDLFATVRVPKVLGMFVLGLWLVRRGFVTSLADHRAVLVRWALLGWGAGLPACVLGAWAVEHWPYLPPSPGGLLGTAAQGAGFPMLALGYAASVALLAVDGRRLVAIFAPVGRLALTNYLTHSLACVVLSYGFGFGLWWRVGHATAMAIAAAVILVQIPLSAIWLRRFRFGPVEWIWRRLTYARPI